MNYSSNAWKQLKNKTAQDLINALLKDGFVFDRNLKTERIYRAPDGRKVSIHFHAKNQSYGSRLMKELLSDIGWTEEDMKRLKLIK